jgi:shikimate kinase
MQRKNLVLIGFMGVGKSTIGRLCAQRLGYAFRDSDKVIEERTGSPVKEIFAAQGEAAFRALEKAVIAELAAMPGVVIATGGGAVLDPENADRLRASGLVVLLTAPPEAIRERVKDAKSRPMLAGAPDVTTRIAELLAERAPYYESAAHYRVETAGRSPWQAASEIADLWRRWRRETRG